MTSRATSVGPTSAFQRLAVLVACAALVACGSAPTNPTTGAPAGVGDGGDRLAGTSVAAAVRVLELLDQEGTAATMQGGAGRGTRVWSNASTTDGDAPGHRVLLAVEYAPELDDPPPGYRDNWLRVTVHPGYGTENADPVTIAFDPAEGNSLRGLSGDGISPGALRQGVRDPLEFDAVSLSVPGGSALLSCSATDTGLTCNENDLTDPSPASGLTSLDPGSATDAITAHLETILNNAEADISGAQRPAPVTPQNPPLPAALGASGLPESRTGRITPEHFEAAEDAPAAAKSYALTFVDILEAEAHEGEFRQSKHATRRVQ